MKIFCSGIGGIGLSAYAALQHSFGHQVSGTDQSPGIVTDDLRQQGILVGFQQDGSLVPEDCDLFVYSEAIAAESPERKMASRLGIVQQSYFQALGELSRGYRVIAVCGTHGKSSTTAMAARVLMNAGLDPTVVVGTRLPDLQGRNWRRGTSSFFVLEACEYRHSFHYLHPSIVLLTTVDGDHFDAYPTLEEYRQSFLTFFGLLPQDGALILHGADVDCTALAMRSGRPMIDADVLPLPDLSIPGEHMRQNGRLVLALAEHLKLPDHQTRASLLGYPGCWRRMEVKGKTADDVLVVDDYAHHPREIRATLQALHEAYPDRRLVAVFQPHTHHRTLTLYRDFTVSFSVCSQLLLSDVYDARHEIEDRFVDGPAFATDIAAGSRILVQYTGSLAQTEQVLRSAVLQPHDLLVCMGAGDSTKLAARMTELPGATRNHS